MEILQEALMWVVEAAILLFEWTGVLVIAVTGIQGIVSYLRRDPLTRLKLAKGLAMGPQGDRRGGSHYSPAGCAYLPDPLGN